MTTTTERLSVPSARMSALASLGRLLLAFVLTLLAALAFFAAFAVGYIAYHEGRVLPGVTVAGIPLGGLDRAAAEAALREQLPSLAGGQLSVTVDGVVHHVAYADIGRDYDIELMLDQAAGLGQVSGSPFDQFAREMEIMLNGVAIEPSATYDGDLLVAQLRALAAAETTAPVDANVVRDGGHFVATPAIEGHGVDLQALVNGAVAVIASTSPADTSVAVSKHVLPPAVTTDVAEAAATRAERVVAHGLTLGAAGSTTTISADTLRGWVRIDESQPGAWPVMIARDPIAQAVASFAETANRQPANAGFKFGGGGVVATPARDGQAIDVPAATDQVLAALNARARGSATDTLGLATVTIAPEYTTAQAQALAGQMKSVAEWTTFVKPGIANGMGANIRVPTETIDGTILYPGQKFDFWDVVGELTAEKGYVLGGAIIHGELDPQGAVGGGMCSVSTTLFNAALRAGLDMRARRNHAWYITRYPVGLDATVWITKRSRLTMSFINDTDDPIMIKGIYTTKGVTFQIWSAPLHRKVVLSDPSTQNVKQPAYYWKVYTDALPAGKKDTQDEHIGMDTTVTRQVFDAGGNLLHRDVWKSHYVMVYGITQVGRYPEDPPSGTKVKIYH
jgi:vancomycin resistance protein YoaR